MIERLSVKDLINIGIFSAMYIVTMMVIVTIFGAVPILYLISPLPVGIGCSVVYSLLVMRVPKKGRGSVAFSAAFHPIYNGWLGGHSLRFALWGCGRTHFEHNGQKH